MLTIETWLNGIGLKQLSIDECLAWPPDLYALAGTLLRRSGTYLRVFERQGCAAYLALGRPYWSRGANAVFVHRHACRVR